MKEKKNKNKKEKKSSKKRKGLTQRQKIALFGFISLIILIVVILSLSDRHQTQGISDATAYETQKDEPQFVKEGELYFLRGETGDTIKKIAIEIADNNIDRQQGLMYRSRMADSLGMLFIFDQAKEQSFWMKNTKISLDILYVDETGKILTLYKYTTPYSESPIPSYEKAQYVVEVIGGFTDRYKINRGDRISFTRRDIQ